MDKLKGLAVLVGLAALTVVVVACGNGEAAETPLAPSGALQPAAGESPVKEGDPGAFPGETIGDPPREAVIVESVGSASAPVAVLSPVNPGYMPSASLQVSGSQIGIWVTGEGSITLQPDLALLNIGVETTAATVASARDEAARAMDAIVAALRGQGIEDKDVQTRYFNISPQYQYEEVVKDGLRSGRQVLVGYTVSNSAAIKIRDLDTVGAVIDGVATAGGDSTRINGISFTVEDTKPLMVQLREQAVVDALAKAQQFANLTNVSLGRLVYIAESGAGAPVVKDFAEQAFVARAAAAPTTSISGGELELSMVVQAAFAIQ